jgi:2-oxoglutarate ferredoxin oxidoreductase subunit gamma
MRSRVIIAGFGGQGILFAGHVLAVAGILEGNHATWLPSYGPQMRGGDASCSVVISDGEVMSPIVYRPDFAVVCNGPSLDTYEPALVPGGVLVFDQDMTRRPPVRQDVTVVGIRATHLAKALGNARLANTLLLGGLVRHTSLVSRSSVHEALRDVIPEGRRGMLESNRRAFDTGFDLVDGSVDERAPFEGAVPKADQSVVGESREGSRRVQVLENLCKGCGICVDVCPKDALAMSEALNSSGYYVAELTQPDACTSCRICALMCPDVALRVFK